MANQLVSNSRQDGKQLLKLRAAPWRTHLPAQVPQWFIEYKKAQDMWNTEVYTAIKILYDNQ